MTGAGDRDLVRVQDQRHDLRIFDTFETVEARQAHIDGEIPKALAAVGPELLATDPDIRPIDIVAAK